jgi:hypothetical protein
MNTRMVELFHLKEVYKNRLGHVYGVPEGALLCGGAEAKIVIRYTCPLYVPKQVQVQKRSRRSNQAKRTSSSFELSSDQSVNTFVATIPTEETTRFLAIQRDGYTERRLFLWMDENTAGQHFENGEDQLGIVALFHEDQKVDVADLLVPLTGMEDDHPPQVTIEIRQDACSNPIATPRLSAKGPSSWIGKFLVNAGLTAPQDRDPAGCVFADRELASTPDHRLFVQGQLNWLSPEDVASTSAKPWRINVWVDPTGIVTATCQG